MPPALSYLYTDQASIEGLLSADGVTGRLDDDASGAASPTEQAYLTQAIGWATAKVNLYLLGKYPAADLANSWIVSLYATVIGAHHVCCRRGNPSAGSIKDLYDEVMEDLKGLRDGAHVLPDVAMRNVAWPAWSNVRLDNVSGLKRLRVERPISDKSETDGRQIRDYIADALSGEP